MLTQRSARFSPNGVIGDIFSEVSASEPGVDPLASGDPFGVGRCGVRRDVRSLVYQLTAFMHETSFARTCLLRVGMPCGSPAAVASPSGRLFELPDVAPRFLTLGDVADELAISKSRVYALVRGSDLPARQVDRGQWRVERSRLEQWIEQGHADTARLLEQHHATTRTTTRRCSPSQPARRSWPRRSRRLSTPARRSAAAADTASSQ